MKTGEDVHQLTSFACMFLLLLPTIAKLKPLGAKIGEEHYKNMMIMSKNWGDLK